MNKQEVFEILTEDWLKNYLCIVTGQEVIKVEVYTYLPLEGEDGKVKEFYTEDYSFRFYFLEGEVYLRKNLDKVVVNDLDELDSLINRQFMEYFLQ